MDNIRSTRGIYDPCDVNCFTRYRSISESTPLVRYVFYSFYVSHDLLRFTLPLFISSLVPTYKPYLTLFHQSFLERLLYYRLTSGLPSLPHSERPLLVTVVSLALTFPEVHLVQGTRTPVDRPRFLPSLSFSFSIVPSLVSPEHSITSLATRRPTECSMGSK